MLIVAMLRFNALFYNLKTGIVEDHTGLGLHDLASGVIRTPYCPFEAISVTQSESSD
jgi:tRNA nucleotidyltransferase/poly(A) polymerase